MAFLKTYTNDLSGAMQEFYDNESARSTELLKVLISQYNSLQNTFFNAETMSNGITLQTQDKWNSVGTEGALIVALAGAFADFLNGIKSGSVVKGAPTGHTQTVNNDGTVTAS